MPSTFSGLEIAKRGLTVHQQAIATTGHNISNADNKHYARQRVNFEAMSPLYDPALNRANGPGMIGQGVQISSIERIRDNFIDDRILDLSQEKASWNIREQYFAHLEIIYNEPSDQAIRASLDKFWASWQELAQFPEEYAHREVVKTRAEELVYNINSTYGKLRDLREQTDTEIRNNVQSLNTLAQEIRDLNEKILKSETLGDRPNDLYDRRDELLQRISSIANINVSRSDANEIFIYIGSEILVQGETVNKLTTIPDTKNEGLSRVVWDYNQKDVVLGNGSLYSLFNIRDKVLREHIDKMDLLAINLHDIVNEIHKDGFSLTGETNIDFFKQDSLSKNIMGNYDLNNDGQNDTTAIFKVAGNNKIKPEQPIGINGLLSFVKNDENHTVVQVAYNANDTVDSVIQKINKSGAGLVAYVNHDNNFALKGNVADDNWQKNFMIRHMEDSGEFLTGMTGILQSSGENGAFDYRRINDISKFQSNRENISFTPMFHPAGSFKLSNDIVNNPGLISASSGKDMGGTGDYNQPNGIKDGSNALKISNALRHEKSMVGEYQNPDDFYHALIAKLGVESREAKDKIEGQETMMKNLETMRQSVMGVNLDEEMSNMVQFQHAYNASAKMLQTINEMLELLISKV